MHEKEHKTVLNILAWESIQSLDFSKKLPQCPLYVDSFFFLNPFTDDKNYAKSFAAARRQIHSTSQRPVPRSPCIIIPKEPASLREKSRRTSPTWPLVLGGALCSCSQTPCMREHVGITEVIVFTQAECHRYLFIRTKISPWMAAVPSRRPAQLS